MLILKSALRTFLDDPNQTIWLDTDLQKYLDIGLTWWYLSTPEKSTFADTMLLSNTAVLMAAAIHSLIDLIISMDDELCSHRFRIVFTEEQYQSYYELLTHAEEQFDWVKQRKWHSDKSQSMLWN